MKKNYKIAGLFILLLVIVATYEVFHYIKNDGNVILYVSNQSAHGDTIDIKIKIDGVKVVDELFIAGDIHDFRKQKLKLSPIVLHEIEIYSEKTRAKMVVYTRFFFVNWVVVDLWDDEIIVRDLTDVKERPICWFTLDRYLYPIVFM